MRASPPTRTSINLFSKKQKGAPEIEVMKGLTIRQGASKAGIRCVLGFEFVYLNDVKTKYGEVRTIIGTKLLQLGFKPKEEQ